MNNKFDNINEALEIEATPIEKEIIKRSPSKLSRSIDKNDLDADYEYTRGHYYALLEKGQEAIDSILELAQSSEKARDFEVALQGIKNVADVADKLMDLQQKNKKIREEETKRPSTVNNSVFIGSTADLHKLIKNGINPEDKTK